MPEPLVDPEQYREWSHPDFPINTDAVPSSTVCTECGDRAGNHTWKRQGDTQYPMCPIVPSDDEEMSV